MTLPEIKQAIQTISPTATLLEKMDREGVERLFLPFVALQNLAEVADREGLAPRRLKEIITAGEQLRVTPALRNLMKKLGGVLENQYGPTETAVDVSSWQAMYAPAGTPPAIVARLNGEIEKILAQPDVKAKLE